MSDYNQLMKYKNVLLFTDLDGTLLNKRTFDFEIAKQFIAKCVSEGIKLIANSSKTDLELDDFCDSINLPKVYICENGAAIYGLNRFNSNLSKQIVFSKNKDSIQEIFLRKIDISIRKKCIFLEDLPISEQVKILGLSKEKVSKALSRKFSVPFIFQGSEIDKEELKNQLEKIQLKVQFGGRVLNLGDNVSKGAAMNKFVNLLSSQTKDKYILIGIGDDENDLDMLDKSHYSCLVKNGSIKLNQIKNKYLLSEKEAPSGWVEVLKKTLQKISDKRI